jgi:hypothetical protein
MKMSIFKKIFGKKDSKSDCCNVQIVEVKSEEIKVEEKEAQVSSSSCCKS